MQCYKTVMLFSADNECLGDNRTQPTPTCIIESHRTQAKVDIQLILLTAVKKISGTTIIDSHNQNICTATFKMFLEGRFITKNGSWHKVTLYS